MIHEGMQHLAYRVLVAWMLVVFPLSAWADSDEPAKEKGGVSLLTVSPECSPGSDSTRKASRSTWG